MRTAVSRYAGSAFSILAVLGGLFAGQLRYFHPRDCANTAGLLWLAALLLVISGRMRPASRTTGWIAAAFIGNALLLYLAQPGVIIYDTLALVLWIAVYLAPATVGGVTMPRTERWLVAIACWFLLFAVTMTTTIFTLWHSSAGVAIFQLRWD